MKLWGIEIDDRLLNEFEVCYLAQLPTEPPQLEWVWGELDRVWEELGLDNRIPLDSQRIDNFYAHPCWLMNGVFSVVDPDSRRHREAVADYLVRGDLRSIADFGSGFGELSRQVMMKDTKDYAEVVNVEPFSHPVVKARLASYPRVRFSETLAGMKFDAIVAQDVLEHVEDPIAVAIAISRATRPGGRLIFANSFWPVIKCHLPSTFVYRHTFVMTMRILGCRYESSVPGAEHALVFIAPERLREGTLRIAHPFVRGLGRLANGPLSALRLRFRVLMKRAVQFRGSTEPRA